MKRLGLTVLFLILSISLFATGTPDLTVVAASSDEDNALALEIFHERYPDVEVEFLRPSTGDGTTITMDQLLQDGNPPNIYTDYMGRVAKYMTEDLAVDLNPYMTDQDDFLPGLLAATTINGKLLGLPLHSGAQGMAVNMDMVRDIGYGNFDFNDWTVAEFLEMCEAVKTKYGGEKFGTGMFAGNQSGDYLWMNWLSSFGAELYGNGYTETTIGNQAGVDVFTFWKLLLDEGYIQRDSAIRVDDDYLIDWAQGKYLATGFFPGWIDIYFKAAADQGMTGHGFEIVFVEFPRAEGIERVPAAGSSPGVVVLDSGDAKTNEQAAYLAWIYTTAPFQEAPIVTGGNFASRKSVQFVNDSDYWKQISKIVADNGMLNLGLTQTFYADVRALGFPRLQALLTGEETPEEAVAAYAANINAAIK